jgi:hypothetical protein
VKDNSKEEGVKDDEEKRLITSETRKLYFRGILSLVFAPSDL